MGKIKRFGIFGIAALLFLNTGVVPVPLAGAAEKTVELGQRDQPYVEDPSADIEGGQGGDVVKDTAEEIPSADMSHSAEEENDKERPSEESVGEVDSYVKPLPESSRVLEDGIYTIETSIDKSKALDVANASLDNGAYLNIWNNGYYAHENFH